MNHKLSGITHDCLMVLKSKKVKNNAYNSVGIGIHGVVILGVKYSVEEYLPGPLSSEELFERSVRMALKDCHFKVRNK